MENETASNKNRKYFIEDYSILSVNKNFEQIINSQVYNSAKTFIEFK